MKDMIVGQNHNIKRANKSFENLTRLKYFGMTVTDQYYTRELRADKL